MADRSPKRDTTPETILRLGKMWAWSIELPSMEFRQLRTVSQRGGEDFVTGSYRLEEGLRLFGPDHVENLYQFVDTILATGEPHRYHANYDDLDGKDWSYQIDASPEMNEDGEIVRIAGLVRDVSAEKRVEKELLRTKRMLERAQSIGRMGHWKIEAATGTLSWSDNMYQMLGMDPGETVSVDRFLGFIDPAQIPAIEQLRRDALSRRSTMAYVADMYLDDGRHIVIETLGEPEFDNEGHLTGYFGVTQDVTDRVLAERAKAVSDQRFQRLFDAMDDSGIGIGVQNAEGDIIAARPALLRLTGFDNEEDVLGKKWSALQGAGGDDIRDKLGASIASAKAGEGDAMRNVEVDWVRPDGARISARIRLAPMPEGERALVVIDQTAQKQAENELIARESRTNTILDAIDAAGIGFAVEDSRGRIITVSPSLRRMMSLPGDMDCLGKHWTQLADFPEDVIAQFEQENASYADGGEGLPFNYADFEVNPGSAHVTIISARSTPLPGIGRLVLTIDVTERRRLSRERHEIELNLQKIQKMEALGRLAGGVAHELNNMLHPIRTFARAALTAEDAEERQHRIGRVIDCADKAREIVKEILVFARGEGRSMSHLDLRDMAVRAVALSRDLRRNDVEIELELPEKPLLIQANETEFTQLLLNLVQNSVDAMTQPGVIRIALSQQTDQNAALLVIEDDGVGMPPEVAAHALEPFFTTKPPSSGTGLGLSVVYGIIDRWGGAMELQSQPGQGTCIRITLPLSDMPKQENA